MTTKTRAFDKHLANANNPKHVWTEGEILAYRMQIHKQEHADDALSLIMAVNEGGYRITKEQSDKGIQYLRSRLWTEAGKPRSSAFSRCFGIREKAIVLKFKRFTFEGVRYEQNPYSGQFNTSPIYRVHATNGAYFDYTMSHWSLPEVL